MAALLRNTLSLCQKCSFFNLPLQTVMISSRQNSNRTSVCRVKRSIFRQMYPTTLVLPDGATINIRYHEPRRIIKLPLDLETLSEEEKKKRLKRRTKIRKIEVKDDGNEDDFSMNKYQYLWKNKKK
ncbi:39S ribosomal protein L55, mitochondrial-like [Mytilus californianus]|uniref:39S ribosomal protein L55, mitochondrial-like n=1 Tax=Mytilus californianus TaxID=6549 RepID=UPI0022467E85|nr:39S ribosomal protein L55, mitochondrial-like [Mytilus californianus]